MSISQPTIEPTPTRAALLQRLAATHRALADSLQAFAEAVEYLTAPPEPGCDVTPDDMLTVTDVARELRRSPAHVRAQCKSGEIKALRDARGYRIRRSALRAYEQRRTR